MAENDMENAGIMAKSSRSAGPQARLLLVEDDYAQRLTLQALLTREGFDVTVCETVSAAKQLLFSERFAVCVLDQRLPDDTAIDLLRGIPKQKQSLPRFIINTAYGSFSSAKDAVNLGAFAYIEKLSDPQELVSAVHNAAHDFLANELKQAESEINLQLRLLDAVQQAVIATDRSFRVIYWNKFAETMYGLSAAEALGNNLSHLLVPSGARTRLQEMMVKLKDGQSWRDEFEVTAPNAKTFPVEIIISPILVEPGKLIGLIGISTDITERQRLYEEHETLQEQLYQAQKMETVGRLAGGIAHDFNNIVCAIQVSAELLGEELKDVHQAQPAIKLILQSGERAQDLTKQLLAFSRKQNLSMITLDLNRVIQEFSVLLRRTLREDILIEVSLAPELNCIEGDVGQLERVLLNLALNAQDAMPGGGVLTIETAMATPIDLARFSVPILPARYVRVKITDTGIGIAPEVIDNVFEPFFTTKPDHRGTGLGLASVLGVVKQHGGNIDVQNAADSGTVFTICLPGVSDAAPVEPTATKTLATACGTEHILLVEDDSDVRTVTRKVLENHGYTVFSKPDGVAALFFQENHPGRLDLLLTDLVMPNMNGRNLAEYAVSRDPNLKVMFMSGYTDDLIDDQFLADHQYYIIYKPFTVHQLTSKVREVLDETANGSVSDSA